MFIGVNSLSYIFCLGQNKEQLTPSPPPPRQKKSNVEGATEQKRAILASLKWGEE